jgi:hypothetical protein
VALAQLIEAHKLRLRKTAFLSHVYIKTIILPRQARDKHRENSKRDAVFRTRLKPLSGEAPKCAQKLAHLQKQINARLFRTFIYKNDRFAKTGSGHTRGNLKIQKISYVCPEPVLVKMIRFEHQKCSRPTSAARPRCGPSSAAAAGRARSRDRTPQLPDARTPAG